MGPTGRAMRAAAIAAVLAGCGATQSPNTGTDAAMGADTAMGTDVVVAIDAVSKDVVSNDVPRRTDVVDAATPMDVADVVTPVDNGVMIRDVPVANLIPPPLDAGR